MKKSNYNKNPIVNLDLNHTCHDSWQSILPVFNSDRKGEQIIVIECYFGTNISEIEKAIRMHNEDARIYNAHECYLSQNEIDDLTFDDVTDDRIFGFMTRLKIDDILDIQKLDKTKEEIADETSDVYVLGTGASKIVDHPDVFVYADMARWELQMRMRREEIGNLGADNSTLEISRKYKRAYFVDWRICDRIKKETFENWDYYLDTNTPNNPKAISKRALSDAMDHIVSQPFRVVPFFDPGPWGGQWMREVCDLDPEPENFAWCFDCVPEENSVKFSYNNCVIEMPSINLVFFKPKQLLGNMVYARFGTEFPIRFDFLDTMQGGNLSLQVHPLTEYIQEYFGMNYTQDESYYMLDAGEDAEVYLGLKNDISKDDMVRDLKRAQYENVDFDADRYVAKWPAKIHDHFLIPAGTVHCSCENCMVLEISATPYIFTFKLWDWGRLGMDGMPRPINIERGVHSIQWFKDEDWTKDNLIDQITPLLSGDGWHSEKTGLHKTEFIETIRHWFTKKVPHDTDGNLNVLNLVEGAEAIVESPTNSFEPFIVHYAETFIIPADVGKYSIRPHGSAEGQRCATIKAYVKNG